MRQNLARVLSSSTAPVERLGKDAYVINDVVAKRQGSVWVLVTKNHERYTVHHTKVAMVLPWLLNSNRTHDWLLKNRIVKLDREYSWLLFDQENQERVLKSAHRANDNDKLLIMATKYEQTRQRLRNLTIQIHKALSNVKINK